MVCPICNEEMVTLLQLNRHLDDVHKEIEEEQQDEVKDWFKQQMVKAKKFQPLMVLNQKFKGLEVFESNHDMVRSSTPTPRNNSIPRRSTRPELQLLRLRHQNPPQPSLTQTISSRSNIGKNELDLMHAQILPVIRDWVLPQGLSTVEIVGNSFAMNTPCIR